MNCKDFNYIAYKFGTEDAGETRAIRRHVKTCERCQKKIRELEKIDTLMADYYTGTRQLCPSPEMLVNYASGDMTKKDRSVIKRHIDRCPGCAEELRGLEAIQEVECTIPGLKETSATFDIKQVEKEIASRLKVFKKKVSFSPAFCSEFAKQYLLPDPVDFSSSIHKVLSQPIMNFKEDEKNKALWEGIKEIQLMEDTGKSGSKKKSPQIKLEGSSLKCSVPSGKSKKSSGK